MDSFLNVWSRRFHATVRVDMTDIVEAENSPTGGSVIRTADGLKYDCPTALQHYFGALCKAHSLSDVV